MSGQGDEQVITFRTNVGDVVEAGPEHPLRFVDEDETGGLKPYSSCAAGWRRWSAGR
jgi:hypothetical protein